MLQRTAIQDVIKILKKWGKMAFIAGPRQVGKTTLAEQALAQFGQGRYFNWDLVTDQRDLARDPYFFAKQGRNPDLPFLLVFDEIHKYSRWKSYLKGVYDGFHKNNLILVTGSGRLDLYKRGGDSLLGRYISLPLFPLTVGELLGERPRWREFKDSLQNEPSAHEGASEIFDRLLCRSGFPEPYLKNEPDFYLAWSEERNRRLVREDIRDATNIRNISLVEMLIQLLPPRVGSPLSINALREELGVAFETARDWLRTLAHFYYFFGVAPYTRKLSRSLKKESKIYFYDWCQTEEPGYRFENLVALHLLKSVRTWAAVGEAKLDLCYLRDREKREVDFAIIENGRPVLLIECKLKDQDVSPHLLYFQEKLDVPMAVQLVSEKGVQKKWNHLNRTQWVVSADRWLGLLL